MQGGFTGIQLRGDLRFLRGPQEDLADEALRRLRNNCLYSVSYILWLQHLTGILARVWRKIRRHSSGANRADSYAVLPEVLGHALAQAQ